MEVKECFLCGRNGNGDRLERHHIFGAAKRPLSEKYGLIVYLCGNRCHRNGEYSAEQNAEVAKYLHQYGQRKAMEDNNWTTEEFIKVFGKNYL